MACELRRANEQFKDTRYARPRWRQCSWRACKRACACVWPARGPVVVPIGPLLPIRAAPKGRRVAKFLSRPASHFVRIHWRCRRRHRRSRPPLPRTQWRLGWRAAPATGVALTSGRSIWRARSPRRRPGPATFVWRRYAAPFCLGSLARVAKWARQSIDLNYCHRALTRPDA